MLKQTDKTKTKKKKYRITKKDNISTYLCLTQNFMHDIKSVSTW